MKTKTIKTLTISLLAFGVLSCTKTQKTQESSDDVSDSIEVKANVTLTKAPSSPEYPDARLLKMASTTTETDSGYAVNYTFDVQDYELGIPTEDYETRGIANSAKGQHIHYIVNNGPYAAHYMPGVNDMLDEGNYVVLAFLSRSYHESVKSEAAYYVENLTIGQVEPDETDLTAPHLFYSRPKGTYSGDDTGKVMLDFYLLNTTLSLDGNQVRATINGSEFIIDEWAPYYIEGLPMGKNEIKLELLNADGNPTSGPFNTVERSITLEE